MCLNVAFNNLCYLNLVDSSIKGAVNYPERTTLLGGYSFFHDNWRNNGQGQLC